MKILLPALFVIIFALLGFTNFYAGSPCCEPDITTLTGPTDPLKAILIVGPLEDITDSSIESMDKIAGLLKSKGVKVHRFYNTNADWDKIKAASKGANFFIYSGHGSTLGEGGKSGGLCLQSMVSSNRIVEELELHSNAIVIFKSVCRGAGSSADDSGDIGIGEATIRVSDYATPFFKIGASCYYANNLGDGCLTFLSDFFSGKTIKECFELSAKRWTKIELSKKYPWDNAKEISIASTDWGGTTTRTTYANGLKKVEKIPTSKQYNIAYVGYPDFTIYDVMK